MANYELRSIVCPSCGGQIDLERLNQAKNGNIVLCPYCGVSLNMKKKQEAKEIGYEYQQGIIMATEEYNARKRREYAIAQQKQQLIAAENERKRAIALEIRRKKYEKRSWVHAIVMYIILIGIAYILAHESMAWALSEKFSLPEPWFVDINGGILSHIAGFILWGFTRFGVVIALVYAFVHFGSKLMMAVPWLYLWELVFIVLSLKLTNQYGFFEAIGEIITDITG